MTGIADDQTGHSLAQSARERITGTGAILVCGPLAIAAGVTSIMCAPGLVGIMGAALAVLMLAIAAVDLQSFRIPNAFSGAAFVLAIAHAGLAEPNAALGSIGIALMRGAALGSVFLGIRELYLRIRGREGLGLGDVKLAAVAGIWLDWSTMLLAVEVAALSGISVYAIGHLVFGRPISCTSRLPFGAFFAPVIWICWLCQTVF